MGENSASLAALIGSRICHDLISPIGAINNGLELLNMAGGSAGPEMDLITESVENASARIRFFRIAYGAAGDRPVGRSEVVSILKDYTNKGRLTVAYGPLEGQPRWAVRMAFLALQCFESAMPYGGRIEVTCEAGKWRVLAHPQKLAFDEALWARIDTGDAVDLAPAHVQFPLLHHLARDWKRTITYQQDTETLQMQF